MAPSSRVLPCFVSHEIRRDSEQPRSLIGDVLLSQRTDERLLRDFFGPVPVPKAPRQVSHQRGVVGSKESLDVAQCITSSIEWL